MESITIDLVKLKRQSYGLRRVVAYACAKHDAAVLRACTARLNEEIQDTLVCSVLRTLVKLS